MRRISGLQTSKTDVCPLSRDNTNTPRQRTQNDNFVIFLKSTLLSIYACDIARSHPKIPIFFSNIYNPFILALLSFIFVLHISLDPLISVYLLLLINCIQLCIDIICYSLIYFTFIYAAYLHCFFLFRVSISSFCVLMLKLRFIPIFFAIYFVDTNIFRIFVVSKGKNIKYSFWLGSLNVIFASYFLSVSLNGKVLASAFLSRCSA